MEMWRGRLARSIALLLFIAIVATLLLLATKSQPGEWRITEMTSPAGNSSVVPSLTSLDGRVWMSWMQKVNDQYEFRFSELQDGQWRQSKLIASNEPFFVNWADTPTIAAVSDRMLVAHWPQKSGAGSYSYDAVVTVSTDGGQTWSKPERPHKDGTESEHGFVSILDEAPGRFSLVWLDGRNFKEETHGHHSSNEMLLRWAVFDQNHFLNDVQIDGRVCDCCQTAAVNTPDGLFVAYRDRSENEVRDISYVLYSEGKWSEPRTLHRDGWEIAACPVNGPSVSANGRNLAVVWFTAEGQRPRIYVIFSNDSGRTFGKPLRIDEGNPVGRGDVEWLTDGSVVVSWMENTSNQGAEIRLRRIKNGIADTPFTLAKSTAARSSGFPKMERYEKGVIIAWTDTSDPSKVRVANVQP